MYERVSLAPWSVKRLAMSVYARDGSQLSVKVPSQLHRHVSHSAISTPITTCTDLSGQRPEWAGEMRLDRTVQGDQGTSETRRTVDGPRVGRASRRVGVPELHLKDLALNFSAAGVLDGGLVLTG